MSDKTRRKQDEQAETTAAPFHGHTATRREILTGTAMAAAAAVVLLLVAILPAEYGVDPTGFGRWTGIARLSGTSGPEGNATSGNTTTVLHRLHDAPFRNDTVEVTIRPHDGVEYKLRLEAGDSLVYAWSAPQPLYFGFHGEPFDLPPGAQPGYYESYEEDTKASANGAFQASFNGRHGWYWENKSDQPVTVTLRISGYYEMIGLI